MPQTKLSLLFPSAKPFQSRHQRKFGKCGDEVAGSSATWYAECGAEVAGSSAAWYSESLASELGDLVCSASSGCDMDASDLDLDACEMDVDGWDRASDQPTWADVGFVNLMDLAHGSILVTLGGARIRVTVQ
jgi:hypothetical protein